MCLRGDDYPAEAIERGDRVLLLLPDHRPAETGSPFSPYASEVILLKRDGRAVLPNPYKRDAALRDLPADALLSHIAASLEGAGR